MAHYRVLALMRVSTREQDVDVKEPILTSTFLVSLKTVLKSKSLRLSCYKASVVQLLKPHPSSNGCCPGCHALT